VEAPTLRETSDGEILAGLADALAAGGAAERRLVLTEPPALHARSTIYFIGDADQPSLGCQWVVKRPEEQVAQEDLANPLNPLQQFEALRTLAAHYEGADSSLRVVRPIAHLPAVGAFAMEYAAGRSLDRLVGPRSVIESSALRRGIVLSARFLRHLHAIESPVPGVVSPRAAAQELLAFAHDTLRPVSLALPREAEEALAAVSEAEAPATLVRLHGDFAPVNMIMTDAAQVTAIDVSLDRVGAPEEDLARFLTMLVTDHLFLVDLPPLRALRRRAEEALLGTYFGHRETSVVFEVHLMRQLCLRWLRRHLTRRANAPSVSRVRTEIVDYYFQTLLRERARALQRAAIAVVPSSRVATGAASPPHAG
jgi:aminoglycoside phosphotransferase (APT) family kinase protein